MSSRFFTTLLALGLAGLLVSCTSSTGPSANTESGSSSICDSEAAGPVNTTSGNVEGTAGADDLKACSFLGIPFAESTGGDNRWKAPVPIRTADAVEATEVGPGCPQPYQLIAGNRFVPDGPKSEDCLSINVWVPEGVEAGAQLPVMLFVYGGDFETGADGVQLYDGGDLAAEHDVVTVNFNYRVGALGGLAGIDGLEGNFGLLDQQLAMRWVQDNIANFGGDPDQVLLYGQSAGAISTVIHLLSAPASEGLFESALLESYPAAIPLRTVEEARPVAEALLMLLDCSDVECLRGKSSDEIVQAQSDPSIVESGAAQRFAAAVPWAPVIDDNVINRQPSAAADDTGITKPILLRTNLNEGVLFIEGALGNTVPEEEYEVVLAAFFGAEDAARILDEYPAVAGNNFDNISTVVTDYLFFCACQDLATSARDAIYTYEFTMLTPVTLGAAALSEGCKDLVCHGDELPYVFHQFLDELDSDSARPLSDQMNSYWTNFAESGDPNGSSSDLPNWPSFTDGGDNYLELKPDPTAIAAPTDEHRCSFWDEIGYGTTASA